MKHFSGMILAAFMALLTAMLVPVQAVAATPDYIGEIKVAMGDSAEDDLKGYVILKNGDTPIDLNQNAGGGIGSKGDNRVLLGYKTTKNRSEAITDLALMNMKGGYSVEDYDFLMNNQIKEQIIPFVEKFLVTIDEYRANYKSKIKANKERALYMHDLLNEFIDDDTGKPLGDLLLKKTKFEMNESVYNDLAPEKKKEHADILTIISQANGQATLAMEKILTRAADTYQNSWLDRFAETSYEVLVNETGRTPTDAKKELAKKYDDDASIILDKWDELRDDLLTYNEAVKFVNGYKAPDLDALKEQVEALDDDSDSDELIEARKALSDAEQSVMQYNKNANIIAVYEYLNARKYEDGTMLDFFMKTYKEMSDNVNALYPMVASLSDGQRAGLEFVTLEELIIISQTDTKAYQDADLTSMNPESIYKGVDRDIYKKGGVAITSDALRAKAMNASTERGIFETPAWLYVMMGVSAAATLGFITSTVAKYVLNKNIRIISNELNRVNTAITEFQEAGTNLLDYSFESAKRGLMEGEDVIIYQGELSKSLTMAKSYYAPGNSLCNKLMLGFGIAAVILVGVTTYLSWKEITEHYEVKYSAIPHYMVDEEDIVSYDKKGNKVILSNQSVYYKAVKCNRKSDAENFNMFDDCADMNGDIGSQWLALYANVNEAKAPIIASSLKVVKGSTEIPSGYKTGIHMFGSDTAFNLNSALYDWNKEAPSIYVYFKTDSGTANTTGSNFTAGSLAIAGGGGILAGAAVAALGMTVKKKKQEKAQIA